jgi:hypothetical protein
MLGSIAGKWVSITEFAALEEIFFGTLIHLYVCGYCLSYQTWHFPALPRSISTLLPLGRSNSSVSTQKFPNLKKTINFNKILYKISDNIHIDRRRSYRTHKLRHYFQTLHLSQSKYISQLL